MTSELREYWDGQAATFDLQPDHGLSDPAVRTAWSNLLLPLMPPPPAAIVDLGCGTGTLAVLLAQAGHAVRGVDLSARMVAAATAKAAAAGVSCEFQQGDAAAPPYAAASFDVVLARHVLWVMPDPATALSTWADLLRRGGVLVLVEGRWFTGAGLSAAECAALVAGAGRQATVERLSDPDLWGKDIDDERYLVVSSR